jgi:hypothetical protein
VCAVARRLLIGVGVLAGFWAFGAFSQAHADAFPPRSSASQQARSALRPPSRITAHPLRETVSHLLRTARRPVTPASTAAERVRPVRLAHRVGLPPVAEVPKAAGRPIAGLHGGARGDPSGSSGRQRDGGCHPPPTDPPPKNPPPPLHRVVPHAAKAAPAVRGHPHRPVTAPDHVTPPPQRMKPTGTITHAPRPRAERMALAAPVPAPVSGSGGSDCSRGKTSSGTGDVPRISLPVSGLWSIAPQPAITASRISADKPSFSPD